MNDLLASCRTAVWRPTLALDHLPMLKASSIEMQLKQSMMSCGTSESHLATSRSMLHLTARVTAQILSHPHLSQSQPGTAGHRPRLPARLPNPHQFSKVDCWTLFCGVVCYCLDQFKISSWTYPTPHFLKRWPTSCTQWMQPLKNFAVASCDLLLLTSPPTVFTWWNCVYLEWLFDSK